MEIVEIIEVDVQELHDLFVADMTLTIHIVFQQKFSTIESCTIGSRWLFSPEEIAVQKSLFVMAVKASFSQKPLNNFVLDPQVSVATSEKLQLNGQPLS